MLLALPLIQIDGQDTIQVPLKMRFGLEVSGPVKYAIDPDVLEIEGYAGLDLNEKVTMVAEAGYLDYTNIQYNYEYLSSGYFMEAGVNYNILAISKTKGRYYGGLALRYGLSRYTSSAEWFYSENYWGRADGLIPQQTNWGHYLEFSPGVRAELLRNVSIGWSINVRMLLTSGADAHFRPIYFPGFGNSGQLFSTGFRYYLEFSIPWKRIKVITKPEEPVEIETTESR
jgi:hypothetical protein